MSSIRPTNRGHGVGIPNDDPSMGNGFGSLATGMQQNSMYGQQQQMFDPSAMMKMISTGGMNSNPASGGWDWSKVDRPQNPNAAFLDEFLGHQEDELEHALKMEAQAYATKFAARIINDIKTRNTSGYYKFFLNAYNIFALVPDTGPMLCPIRGRFIEVIKNTQAAQLRIAGRGVTFGARDFALQIMAQNPLDQRLVENLFSTGIANAMFLEMVDWFAKTADGRDAYSKLTNELKLTLTKLPKFITYAGECFQFFNMDSPYNDLSPVPKTSPNPDQNMSQYVVRSTSGSGMEWLGFQHSTESQQQKEIREINEWVANNLRHRQEFQYQQAQQQTPDAAYWSGQQPQQQYSFGELHTKRVDFENVNPDNVADFSLENFKRIPGTDKYVVDETTWSYFSKAFKRAYRPYGELFAGTYGIRVVKINFELNDGWVDNVLFIEGVTPAMALANPAMLLPHLETDQQGNVVIVDEVVLPKEKDEETGIEMVPLQKVKVMEHAPTAVVVPEVVTGDSFGNIETVIDTMFDTVKPSTSGLFGVAIPVENWKRFFVEDSTIVEEIYLRLPWLVKGNGGGTPPTFFDFVSEIQKTMDHYIGCDELRGFVENHITDTVNRWLVDTRGYGGNRDDQYRFRINGIFSNLKNLINHLEKNDPDTFSVLIDPKRFKRLFTKCKLFAARETRSALLNGALPSSPTQAAIAKENDKKAMVVLTDVVVTRIGNILAPNTQKTVINVKRSAFPEMFSLIERSFGKTSDLLPEGVEQVLSFVSDDSLWTFNTSGFDSNVAVMRKVPRTQGMLNFKLIE